MSTSTQCVLDWVPRYSESLFFSRALLGRICMLSLPIFAGCPLMMSSTRCILQFWQRFSRTAEKSSRTSFAWLHELCQQRGLTCTMYWESSKKIFFTSFQYDPQSAHLHEFSNSFRRQSGGGVLYKLHSRLGQMYYTSEEKSELQKFWTEKIIVRVFPYRARVSNQVLNFSCAHAWDKEIWNKFTVYWWHYSILTEYSCS